MSRRSYSVSLPKAWPVYVMFYRSDKSKKPHLGWKLKVGCDVPNSKTGELGSFGTDTAVEFYSKKITTRKIANLVKRALLDQFAHEIDETLKIDGRRALPCPHGRRK